MSRLIEVTEVQGNAPQWIKDAWKGCVLPCEAANEYIVRVAKAVAPTASCRIIMDMTDPDYSQVEAYFVRQDRAINVLAGKVRAAGMWYGQNGYPQPEGYFGFTFKEAKLFEGQVTLVK